jgi:hypothetical protein
MEKAQNVLVIPADIGWSDVGDWSALSNLFPKDESGNAVLAKHLGIDTENCVISMPKNQGVLWLPYAFGIWLLWKQKRLSLSFLGTVPKRCGKFWSACGSFRDMIKSHGAQSGLAGPSRMGPGSPRGRYTEEEARRLISHAERIIRFCKDILARA